MSGFRLTPAAQQDLSQIWEYTESHWDVEQAERYIREIQEAVERIASDPRRGRVRDEIREGYRSYPAQSHVIFYVVQLDGIDVIRILHGRMDPDRHL